MRWSGFLLFFVTNISIGQNINTVAGGGVSLGDGGAATLASIGYIAGVAIDQSGNLFIADGNHNRIRKVDVATGIITTVAGNGLAGFSGDGGAATSAELNNPVYIAFDNGGNLYISDPPNRRIRKVNSLGIITTFAGTGTMGFSGDGGPASSAELYTIQGISFDKNDNLYIADIGANRIRKIDTFNIISTIAGNGSSGFSGDGGAATLATLYNPQDIAIDTFGNLLIADYGNNRIRKVDFSTGIINTVAGDGTGGYSGDGGLATSASINGPMGVSIDLQNNIFIAEFHSQRIRKVDCTDGNISSVAGNGIGGFSGDGGLSTTAEILGPEGIRFDQCGNIYNCLSALGEWFFRGYYVVERHWSCYHCLLNHPIE